MSLISKFIPPIDLPGFFRVESYSGNNQTRLSVKWNLDGNPGEKTHVIERGSATLAEVVEAFPGTEKITSNAKWLAAKMIVGKIPLPPNWVLECGSAPAELEGFMLTFDVGKQHFEKHLKVTKVQLTQLEDLIKWIAEANKIDRHGVGT
jgi:hypothetical protein